VEVKEDWKETVIMELMEVWGRMEKEKAL